MKVSRRKNVLETPRRRRLRRKVFIIKMVFFGIVGLVLVGGIISLARLSYFSVKTVEIEGTERVSKDEVQNMINTISSGNTWWLIPRKQFFVYPIKEIESTIEKNFNQVRDVVIDKKGLHTVVVTVFEYEPFARYCSTYCVLLDEHGYAYKELIEHEYALLPTLYASEGKDLPLFSHVIPIQQFSDVMQFKNKLNAFDFTFKQINIENDNSIRFVLEQGDILVSLEESLESQFVSLQTVLKEIKEFNYIDLRFGKKVFYEEK